MSSFAPSATDEGAEGPQKDPKGPRGQKGPPALRRSKKDGRVTHRSSSYQYQHKEI